MALLVGTCSGFLFSFHVVGGLLPSVLDMTSKTMLYIVAYQGPSAVLICVSCETQAHSCKDQSIMMNSTWMRAGM